MKRYEFTTISYDCDTEKWLLTFPDKSTADIGERDLTELLNELGADGWHIVGTGIVHIFNVGMYDHEIYLEREVVILG